MNDPNLLWDFKRSQLLLFVDYRVTAGARTVMYTSPDAQSWSAPTLVNKYGAPGPGTGATQLTMGPHKGRVLVASYGPGVAVYWSDDLAVWHRSSMLDIPGSWWAANNSVTGFCEPQLVELTNGSVRLDMRHCVNGPGWQKTRGYALSTDSGSHFGALQPARGIGDGGGGCQGSILRVGKTLYLSNSQSFSQRTNLTLHRSTDDGGHWIAQTAVAPPNVPTGYSALVQLGGGSAQVGLVWELVCCSKLAPCGVPLPDPSQCHGNTNTTIVFSALPGVDGGAAGHKRVKADDREPPAPLAARRLRASGSNTKEPSRSFALDPTGVITFTWSSEHTQRGAAQASFHIVVRDAITGRVAYDSGRVDSAFPRHHLPANAQASLETAREHSWSVVWWDAEGRGSPQSTGTFHLGPGADEWAAAPWIGSNVTNLYRTNQLPATEEAAASVMLYVCALGFGSVSVNGEPALQGARMTVSGWTNNERLNLYESYDLTAAARNCSARNAELVIGIALGHGWRAPIFARDDNSSKPGDTTQRVFRALLVVTNRDGTSIDILSGAENWVGARGPVISDSVYDGETYDARLALPGWDAQSSLALASRRERWSAAAVVRDAPRGRMVAQTMPAVVLDRVLTPQSITQPRRGVFVVDFGENVAGYASLRNVRGERGRAIVLHYAEILQHRGLPDVGASYDQKMPYFQNLRSANATDTFILAGTGAEEYVPSFTYHGARYVQVDGFPGTLTADNIEFHHFHTGNARRSSLAFPGSPTLEAIQEMALGTQRSNMMSITTDCDQRDERLGWMGDEELSVHTMLLNWQADEFFSVYMANMASEMDADGSLPDVV